MLKSLLFRGTKPDRSAVASRQEAMRTRRERMTSCRIELLEQRTLLSVGPADGSLDGIVFPDADPLYKLANAAAIYRMYEETGSTEGLGPELARFIDGDRLCFDVLIIGNGEEYAEKLESLGMEVLSVRDIFVGGRLPIEALDDLAQFPGVQYVFPNPQYRSKEGDAYYAERYGYSWHPAYSGILAHRRDPAREENQVRVIFWTEDRIEDLGEFLDGVDWPEQFAEIGTTTAEQLLMFPLGHDPRGGFRTIVTMDLAGAVAARDSIAELEKLDCIDKVRPESESNTSFDPAKVQAGMDALTYTGSDAKGQLFLAESRNLIEMDTLEGDQRFSDVDGSGYACVIIDSGIDVDHPFFGPDNDSNGVADRIVYQWDFRNNDGDASDDNGHGTHVSSIVGSENGTNRGVAPGADLIHLKVTDSQGSLDFGDVEAALDWVVDHAATYNVVSVNMSLGDPQNYSTPVQMYGFADEIELLEDQGVIVVSASGNDFFGFSSAQGVSYPAADPNSLSIGAVYDHDIGGVLYQSGARAFTTDADHIAPFSQRHSMLTTAMAPGAEITAAWLNGVTEERHGTSQAAPHVAGMAVLAQQLADDNLGRWLTPHEFTALLRSTATWINDGDDEDNNVTATGLDFPRVDMFALAEAIENIVEIDADSNPNPGSATDDDNDDAITVSRVGNSLRVNVNSYNLTDIPLSGVSALIINGSSDKEVVTVYNLGDFTGIVDINGGSGGEDLTHIYDSTGNDTFTAAPGIPGVMDAGTGYSVGSSAPQVVAWKTAGGNDTATWYGSSSSDTYLHYKNGAQIQSDGYIFYVDQYDSVETTAVAGGTDHAKFWDSTGTDTFECHPAYATWEGGSTDGQVNDFDKNLSYATQGGNDTANFYGDSTTAVADFYLAGHVDVEQGASGQPTWHIMTGDSAAEYDYYAKYFETVNAQAGTGGNDHVSFYDSPGNDTFTAFPTYATQVFPGGAMQRADYFDNGVHAFGTKGGTDTAHLHGGPGDDIVVCQPVTVEQGADGKPTEGGMFITGSYWNRAKYYENVYAHLDQAGADIAWFIDSDDYDEDYTFDDDEAELQAAAYLYCALGLDASDSAGVTNPLGSDSDTRSILNPLYTLDMTYWEE